MEKCTDKKLAILKAAEKLFAQNGFYGTEVEQIAKTAGMAKGTVYNYFTNKEEILISIIESGIDELEQIMETGIEKSLGVVDKIKSGIRLYVNHLEKNLPLFKIMAAEHIQFKIEWENRYYCKLFSRINRLQEVLAEGVEKGEIKPVDPYIAATALTGMIDFLVFRELFDGKKYSTEHKVKQLTDIILEGIAL